MKAFVRIAILAVIAGVGISVAGIAPPAAPAAEQSK